MVKFIQIFTYLLFTSFFSACFLPKKKELKANEQFVEEILKADKAFSALSAEKGMKNAFLEYIDSNGVLLRPNILPIAGADAVDYLIALKDDNYKITWEPKNAVAAISGELGYTYGTYKLIPNNVDTILYGTYVSIWKKQIDGKWKFVLDTGNDGVGEGN
ncbi:MAG: hypothetical protein ABL929_06665 [Ferruginibacter sp.]|nr:hypothetical protein [Ferruginibacter sp.]